MVVSPVELPPEKGSIGEAQQELQITDVSSPQRGYPIIINPQPSRDDFLGNDRKTGQMVARYQERLVH
jgi:hypothetical protein